FFVTSFSMFFWLSLNFDLWGVKGGLPHCELKRFYIYSIAVHLYIQRVCSPYYSYFNMDLVNLDIMGLL
ncbi:hypothetical protein JT059_02650, partial [Helicobacter pylori]|nr:hypothetical protein [Helicobacter pylori]